MKVYKFGGASVRNADGVQNLLKIIGDERDLFIIVSAMGKTTNALEKVFEGLQKGDKAFSMEHITALRQYHAEIVNELYGAPTRLEKIERLFGELEQVATETVYRPEDAELWYDTVVAFGELISTTIISEYLSERGIDNCWLDMRRCFRTEQRHKDASVDIAASRTLLRNAMKQSKACIFIGQGFIGGAPDGTTTTLGREGSDYSAAVAANILDAESMSVWKDVDGILNADPKVFPGCGADRGTELPGHHRAGLQRGTDHPPQNDQTAAKQEHPALRAAFRGQAKTGHGDSPYVGADRGSDSDSEEGSGIADDPFAGLFLRARREIRGDLLPAGAIPYQGQSGA